MNNAQLNITTGNKSDINSGYNNWKLSRKAWAIYNDSPSEFNPMHLIFWKENLQELGRIPEFTFSNDKRYRKGYCGDYGVALEGYPVPAVEEAKATVKKLKTKLNNLLSEELRSLDFARMLCSDTRETRRRQPALDFYYDTISFLETQEEKLNTVQKQINK